MEDQKRRRKNVDFSKNQIYTLFHCGKAREAFMRRYSKAHTYDKNDTKKQENFKKSNKRVMAPKNLARNNTLHCVSILSAVEKYIHFYLCLPISIFFFFFFLGARSKLLFCVSFNVYFSLFVVIIQ